MAVVQRADDLEGRDRILLEKVQAFLFDDVQAGDAQIADVVAHQARDVVVAYQQNVHRHVFAKGDQLVGAPRVLEAAALQQIQRLFGQSAGFLDGDLDSCWFVGHNILLSAALQGFSVAAGTDVQVNGPRGRSSSR